MFKRTNPQHHSEPRALVRADSRIVGSPPDPHDFARADMERPGLPVECTGYKPVPHKNRRRRVPHKDHRRRVPHKNHRRGSVLVLVMTLLGVLFVLGVTFLATMNFESEMIAGEKRRGGGDQGAATLTDGFRGAMRSGFINSGGTPFGGLGENESGATFAELPGVQNTFSPIEPINMPNAVIPGGAGGDGISGTSDDLNPAFTSFTDASHGNGIPVPDGVLLSSMLQNGESIPSFQPPGAQSPVNLIVCRGGINKGLPCDPSAPEDCPGSTCSGPVAVDADGDGIVDSFLYDAKKVGLSPDQIAKLSVQVNGADSEKNDVFVGMRVIAHGGMANLNASHPTIIEAALGLNLDNLKLIDADGSRDFFRLLHSPSGNPNDSGFPLQSPRSLYSPSAEESLLRRRELIPPRVFPPSMLQGDPFLKDWENINPPIPFGGDMAEFLFWPRAGGVTQNVLEGQHKFDMFSVDDQPRPDILRWSTRMDFFLASSSVEYDRRHLVTTVSHDDLLARGGMVQTGGAASGGQDIIEKMFEVNRARAESDQECPKQFPFEYVRYPHELSDAGDCCDTSNGKAPFDQCTPNVRKGRLELSLAWIDAQLAEARFLRSTGNANDTARANKMQRRVKLVVYDAFYLMIHSAVGEPWFSRPICNLSNQFFCQPGTICKLSPTGLDGRCSASAAYFDDVECTTPGQDSAACDDGEFCSPINYTPNSPTQRFLCSDKWTRLPRSKARLTRIAASLTANLFDFADVGGTPTRIAIRIMDFDMGVCQVGTQAGKACLSAIDCDGQTCDTTAFVRGKSFDFDGKPGDDSAKKSLFVYGLEQQPYITEVVTRQLKDESTNTGWWVELFNPYNQPNQIIQLSDYRIRQYDENGVLQGEFSLTGTIPPNALGGPSPFAVLTSGNANGITIANAVPVSGLSFKEGWTLYLIRRIQLPEENPPFAKVDVDIVVDQFAVPAGLGKEGTPCETDPQCFSVAGRGTTRATPWMATVPSLFGPIGAPTFGDWNPPGSSLTHPVEVNFANTGAFADTAPYQQWTPNSTSNPGTASFPTTGSMLLLMRQANRAITDMDGPPTPGGSSLQPITDLAFTAGLAGEQAGYFVRGPNDLNARPVLIPREQQIDNGRMPVFDLGEDPSNPAAASSDSGVQAVHHVPAQRTPAWNPFDPASKQLAGSARNLPWGQLVFDYFTAIPLDSPGPYPPCSGNGTTPCKPAGSPDAKPRVDLDGLRVQGRINLNAAPATVLQGLPFVPMQNIPIAFRNQIRTALAVTVADAEAQPIGFDRAQAIVAYRDARSATFLDRRTGQAITTGDYGALTDPTGTISGTGIPSFGWRGWTDTQPAVRRGTGFASVGELANVRHEVVPPDSRIASPATRLDNLAVDFIAGNNDTQGFVTAAAFLIALNDWATVRSHVFTIYGQIRGVENENITDPDFALEASLRRKDVDSRAIRFQETVDRLPTFLGKALPVRIGNRTVGAYLDTSND